MLESFQRPHHNLGRCIRQNGRPARAFSLYWTSSSPSHCLWFIKKKYLTLISCHWAHFSSCFQQSLLKVLYLCIHSSWTNYCSSYVLDYFQCIYYADPRHNLLQCKFQIVHCSTHAANHHIHAIKASIPFPLYPTFPRTNPVGYLDELLKETYRIPASVGHLMF